MTAKRNRWLVGTVLTLALAAFLSLSLLPILGGNNNSRRATGTNSTAPPDDPAAMQAELESQAKGYGLVLEREPDNQTALQGLIDTQIQLGNLAGVVAPLEKLVELNPTVPEYQVLLAQTKQQLGDLEGSAQAYRQVLDQNPGDINALQGLTALLVQQERPQAAIGLLQDTLKTAEQVQGEATPTKIDTTSVTLLLAQVYVETNDADQALKLYDQVIAASPEDFRPVLAKALVLQEQGDSETAQSLFTQATAMAPAQFKDQIQQMAAQSQNPALLPVGPETVPLPDAKQPPAAQPPASE